GEFLVVAAESRDEARGILHDGGLDLVETVRPVRLTDHPEYALTPRLLRGQKVAHPARRVHRGRHGFILSDASRRHGRDAEVYTRASRPRARIADDARGSCGRGCDSGCAQGAYLQGAARGRGSEGVVAAVTDGLARQVVLD